jgi:hypothetical protein
VEDLEDEGVGVEDVEAGAFGGCGFCGIFGEQGGHGAISRGWVERAGRAVRAREAGEAMRALTRANLRP